MSSLAIRHTNELPRPTRVRWPIYLQLLVPMVAVVLLTAMLSMTIAAAWSAAHVRSEQRASLQRVVDMVAQVSYPLTQNVLTQIRGFSGAEIVLLDRHGRLAEHTLPADAATVEALRALAAQPDQRPAALTSLRLGDRVFLVDHVPVLSPARGEPTATAFILYGEEKLAAQTYRAMLPALISGLIATFLALCLSVWLARRLVRPIHTLAAQTARIAEGDFAPMPIPRPNDELRDLAESINRMAVRLGIYEDDVRRSERLRTLGQLGAALAHQLRNAAAGGRIAIELHQRDCANGDDESLDVALRQLRLMESYLQRFLGIGGSAPRPREVVALDRLVDEVLTLLRPASQHAGVVIEVAASTAPACLLADAEGIRQLLTNLIGNAIEAVQGQGHREPSRREPGDSSQGRNGATAAIGRVSIVLGRDGDTGTLEVCDNGPGPAAEVRARLFEPFATAKPSGVGLGLWVAQQIAVVHGGSLAWQRRAGQTVFTFQFPLAHEPALAARDSR